MEFIPKRDPPFSQIEILVNSTPYLLSARQRKRSPNQAEHRRQFDGMDG